MPGSDPETEFLLSRGFPAVDIFDSLLMVREMELGSSRTDSSPLGCTFHGWIASCEAHTAARSGELCTRAVHAAVCRAPPQLLLVATGGCGNTRTPTDPRTEAPLPAGLAVSQSGEVSSGLSARTDGAQCRALNN